MSSAENADEGSEVRQVKRKKISELMDAVKGPLQVRNFFVDLEDRGCELEIAFGRRRPRPTMPLTYSVSKKTYEISMSWSTEGKKCKTLAVCKKTIVELASEMEDGQHLDLPDDDETLLAR